MYTIMHKHIHIKYAHCMCQKLTIQSRTSITSTWNSLARTQIHVLLASTQQRECLFVHCSAQQPQFFLVNYHGYSVNQSPGHSFRYSFHHKSHSHHPGYHESSHYDLPLFLLSPAWLWLRIGIILSGMKITPMTPTVMRLELVCCTE